MNRWNGRASLLPIAAWMAACTVVRPLNEEFAGVRTLTRHRVMSHVEVGPLKPLGEWANGRMVS